MSAIVEILESFAANRKLTTDLLDSVTSEDLHCKFPRPGLDTIAKHIREMAAVQSAFVQAAKEGTMDFSAVPDVDAFEDADAAILKAELDQADASMNLEALSDSSCPDVIWDGEPISLEKHLVSLVAHEVFHQGMITMMLYYFGVKLPDTWVDSWALPQVHTA